MNKKRQEKGGIRWIIEGAKKRSTSSHFAKQNVRATFSECLALSVLEAFVGQGQAREKRDQLHRTAEANRAYLRYRWFSLAVAGRAAATVARANAEMAMNCMFAVELISWWMD